MSAQVQRLIFPCGCELLLELGEWTTLCSKHPEPPYHAVPKAELDKLFEQTLGLLAKAEGRCTHAGHEDAADACRWAITQLRLGREQAEELRRLKQERALIEAAIGERGMTDASTPLHIRAQNLAEHWSNASLRQRPEPPLVIEALRNVSKCPRCASCASAAHDVLASPQTQRLVDTWSASYASAYDAGLMTAWRLVKEAGGEMAETLLAGLEASRLRGKEPPQ